METETEQRGCHGKRQKGGWFTMPFIISNEMCEKVAVIGFNVNLISYLTTQLHMPLTEAANTLTNFAGTSSLTPLLGAFLADAYAGRFWTITVASIIYQISLISLTLSAILPQLRPPQCKYGDPNCKDADSGQQAVLYISLLLGTIGSGGIRACVVAFGAEQFDGSDPEDKKNVPVYFNLYYTLISASALVAVTVFVYIQDNVGWGWGFGIPTFTMLLSIIAFLFGHRLYRKLTPAGSPYTRFVQVIVAAFKKRRLPMISDPALLYRNDELDAPISVTGKLLHTKHLKFFDKAAIVTEEDDIKPDHKPNPWRLNTVHRVEEAKSIIRLVPFWGAGILFLTAYAQQNTYYLQQAKSMDRHLSKSFQIPAGSMQVFTMVSILITIPIYDRIFVPFIRKFTGVEGGISKLHRMGIGLAISTLASLVAGFAEVKRKHSALAHGVLDSDKTIPMSVFWLAPQYCLHGIAEAFTSVGQLEFFYDQAPESMRSTAMALFWTSISAGNYVSSLLVTLVHKFSGGSDGSNWLPDNSIDKGKLENFYWLITLLQVANLIYYLVCAKLYTYKPIQSNSEKGGDDDSQEDGSVELVSNGKV